MLSYTSFLRQYGTDPAPSWRWIIRFPDLGDCPTPYTFRKVLSVRGLTAHNVTLPRPEIGTNDVFEGGRNISYPNFVTIGTMSASFVEKKEYLFNRYLESWRGKVFNPYGMYYYPANSFRLPVEVLVFDIVKSSPVAKFIARGCWPSEIQDMEFDYEQSTYVRVDATFVVNSVEFSDV